jgi:hypothetical protein
VASQRFMTALQDQQEVMADLADMIMQVMRWSRRCCGRASAAACREVATAVWVPSTHDTQIRRRFIHLLRTQKILHPVGIVSPGMEDRLFRLEGRLVAADLSA